MRCSAWRCVDPSSSRRSRSDRIRRQVLMVNSSRPRPIRVHFLPSIVSYGGRRRVAVCSSSPWRGSPERRHIGANCRVGICGARAASHSAAFFMGLGRRPRGCLENAERSTAERPAAPSEERHHPRAQRHSEHKLHANALWVAGGEACLTSGRASAFTQADCRSAAPGCVFQSQRKWRCTAPG